MKPGQQIGFVRCPFDQATFEVKDGKETSGWPIAGLAPSTPSLMVRLFPYASRPGSHRSGSAIAAVPASNSPSRCSRDFLRKVWPTRSRSRSLMSLTRTKSRLARGTLSPTISVFPVRPDNEAHASMRAVRSMDHPRQKCRTIDQNMAATVTLAPLLNASPAIQIHAFAGDGGTCNRRRSTRFHEGDAAASHGWLDVVTLMCVVAVSSLFIHELRMWALGARSPCCQFTC